MTNLNEIVVESPRISSKDKVIYKDATAGKESKK